jgi:hypothetical protein
LSRVKGAGGLVTTLLQSEERPLVKPISQLLSGPVVGMLVTKDEGDKLLEVLRWAAPLCEAIYALAGDAESEQLIRKHIPRKCACLLTDQDLDCPPFKDYHRQLLLERIQADFPPGGFGKENGNGWVLLLHGDEIWEDNPLEHALVAESQRQREGETGFDTVVVEMASFFLHPDGGEWVKYPLYREQRMFRNVAGLYYPKGQNYQTTPVGISGRHVDNFYPVARHYTYRSPDQAWRRAWDNHTRRRCRQVATDWILDNRTCFTGVDPETGRELVPWEKVRTEAAVRREAKFQPLLRGALNKWQE